MNKTQLIEKLSQSCNLSCNKCQLVLNSLKNILYDALKKGEEIKIADVGKFYVKQALERKIINPKTKRAYLLPARNLIAFKICDKLKKSID